jgi:RNA polymerase sigma-70 factor (ECF subfamily)
VVADSDDARTRLAPFLSRARAECPEVTATALSDEELVAYLARVRPLAELMAEESVHAGDLLLAAGCVAKCDAALAGFEKRFVPDLKQALRTVDGSAGFADEILQELRDRLFVAPADGEPQIVRYSGRGPLGGWLRVVAMRDAIGKRRKNWREVPVEAQLATFAAGGRTPEQEVAFKQHEAALQSALRAAVKAQPSRARALLRYYYCDGVGVEELGKIYRVHASTASRWLAQAREDILADTRKRLAAALAREESQVESMLGLARSLEVSLDTLLRTSLT